MPYGGGYDGFVRALETGEDGDRDSDDTGGSTVTARLQSRPLTFGEQQIEKRGRVVRGGVTAPSEATVTYHAVADGSVNAGRGVTHPASSGPVSKKARVSARGYVLGVRAEWSDPGLTLQALQMEAKPLRKGW